MRVPPLLIPALVFTFTEQWIWEFLKNPSDQEVWVQQHMMVSHSQSNQYPCLLLHTNSSSPNCLEECPFPSSFESSVAFLSADVCRFFAALLDPSINVCTLENSWQEDCEVVKLLSKSGNGGETHTQTNPRWKRGGTQEDWRQMDWFASLASFSFFQRRQEFSTIRLERMHASEGMGHQKKN